MSGEAADGRGELVDVVDEHDRVVDVVPRAVMRERNLRHRSVAVVVQSTDGRLLVHRRAEHKDVWPGQWDLCVGGVVTSGESYVDAARRELAEEVGIEVGIEVGVEVDAGGGLEWLASGAFDDDDVREISHVFRVVHDGPYRFDDGEVVEARLVDPDGFAALATSERFLPDSWAMVLPLLGPFADAVLPSR